MDYLPQMVTIVGGIPFPLCIWRDEVITVVDECIDILSCSDHSSTLISCAVEASHRHFSPSQFTSIIAKTVHIARGKKDEEPE